jgi:uncharacterized protein (DUF488 family)
MEMIYTIGHSTRSIEDFIKILQAYEITLLVDVRTVPKSRHVPQFNSENLERSLKEQHIKYVHLAELGGLRKPHRDSLNLGWKNASFRGYADYMQTEEFSKGMDRLIKLAKKHTVVIMCAEAVPWRCHRSLIGDALLARKIKVSDILSETKSQAHKKTSFAKIRGLKIIYPARGLRQLSILLQ